MEWRRDEREIDIDTHSCERCRDFHSAECRRGGGDISSLEHLAVTIPVDFFHTNYRVCHRMVPAQLSVLSKSEE
jgi:hypothetical protein